MTAFTGVLLALVAMAAWGVGDYLIQRTTRLVGDWKALLYIGLAGLIVLFPFVYSDLGSLTQDNLILLAVLGLVMVVVPIIDFEALRQGKMAVIEPIIGMELPLTVVLSIMFAHEYLSPFQLVLVGAVFVGIMLTVATRLGHLQYHKRLFERGALYAVLAALGMAASNFLVGESSQNISPLVAVWAISLARVVLCSTYLIARGQFFDVITNAKKNPVTILGQSILDNIAWISFGFATTLIPISIATTISGGYVSVAVLLGIFVSREKLKPHQFIGIALVSIGIIVLSYFYG